MTRWIKIFNVSYFLIDKSGNEHQVYDEFVYRFVVRGLYASVTDKKWSFCTLLLNFIVCYELNVTITVYTCTYSSYPLNILHYFSAASSQYQFFFFKSTKKIIYILVHGYSSGANKKKILISKVLLTAVQNIWCFMGFF